MQKLIATYLFQHKKLVLPKLGTLEIRNAEALAVTGEQKITAPAPVIYFSDHIAAETTDLAAYIASNRHISMEEAVRILEKYSEEIRDLQPGNTAEIKAVGCFYRDADEKISFSAFALPAYYLPDVAAERVIHPDSTHSILVGDKETDSVVMTEYYAEEAPLKKQRWWIAAIILFLVAAAMIFYYLSNKEKDQLFGISKKIPVKSSGENYRKIP